MEAIRPRSGSRKNRPHTCRPYEDNIVFGHAPSGSPAGNRPGRRKSMGMTATRIASTPASVPPGKYASEITLAQGTDQSAQRFFTPSAASAPIQNIPNSTSPQPINEAFNPADDKYDRPNHAPNTSCGMAFRILTVRPRTVIADPVAIPIQNIARQSRS
jgi:hypothetical protein